MTTPNIIISVLCVIIYSCCILEAIRGRNRAKESWDKRAGTITLIALVVAGIVSAVITVSAYGIVRVTHSNKVAKRPPDSYAPSGNSLNKFKISGY